VATAILVERGACWATKKKDFTGEVPWQWLRNKRETDAYQYNQIQ